jgi:hypothetical protein
MTIDECVDMCRNYSYVGLEYGSQCWCSNSIQNGAFPVDDDQCDMLCAGDPQQICGSRNALSIFMPPPPAPDDPVRNITYAPAGCYAEPRDGTRALDQSVTSSSAMTPTACYNICGMSGFLFAGLEYGAECWCDNKLSPKATLVDPRHCNMKCIGDDRHTCGGRLLLNLYNGTYNPSAAAELRTYAPIKGLYAPIRGSRNRHSGGHN